MKQLIYNFTFITFIFIAPINIKAQVNIIQTTGGSAKRIDSSNVLKIVAQLRLNKVKSAEFMSAMQLNSEVIKTLIENKSMSPKERFESIKLLQFERNEKVLSILDSNQREEFKHRMQLLFAQRLIDRDKHNNEDALEIEKHLPKTYYNDNTPKRNEEVADQK